MGIASKKSQPVCACRFVFKNPPFGYSKVGEKKERHLVVQETQAKIIRFIYDACLRDVPLYKIKEKAYQLGFNIKGTMAVEKVLANPVYAGLLHVDQYKEYPGGLFPGIHEPIIDITTWQMVQNKLKKPLKTRTVIDNEIPLRGILKCHCGNPLSGAPSRGKSGKYFYYYKCRFSKHNNISAVKANSQLLGAFELMSLPENKIQEIRNNCKTILQREMEVNRKKGKEKQEQLEDTQEKLFALEEKWIKNEINRDTYDRWYSNYKNSILSLQGAVERLNKNEGKAFDILEKNLYYLTDMHNVYTTADTLQKRELVSMVFDNNLYYQESIYRTPTLMPILSHNSLLMKEKGFLIYEKKRDDFSIIPPSGERGIRTPGPVTVNGFQDRRIRPLCHLSAAKIRWLRFYSKTYLKK